MDVRNICKVRAEGSSLSPEVTRMRSGAETVVRDLDSFLRLRKSLTDSGPVKGETPNRWFQCKD